MIESISGSYILICDICGEGACKDFDDFYEAVDYKKKEGWKGKKINGEWQDVCPDCQEEE